MPYVIAKGHAQLSKQEPRDVPYSLLLRDAYNNDAVMIQLDRQGQ